MFDLSQISVARKPRLNLSTQRIYHEITALSDTLKAQTPRLHCGSSQTHIGLI